MASFFSRVGQGFGRQPNKGGSNNGGKSSSNSPTGFASPTSAPSLPPFPVSPALSAVAMDDETQPQANNRRPPFFFREEYSTLIVRGNFMTLAAKPVHVEEGEWLAHQVVEQYRLLDVMLGIIKVVDERTGQPLCNSNSCPTMSAAGHTYTWLDQAKRPIKIPAVQYIHLVQRWINGKISDPSLFPTDTDFRPSYSAQQSASSLNSGLIAAPPTNINAPLSALSGRSDWFGKVSGFPESFETDIKSIYRQMMRCYAHIYHGHWLDPFWHTNAYKELNTCFLHFVNVGKTFGLLAEKEIEPMGPLIDIWTSKGLLPTVSVPAPIGSGSGNASSGNGSNAATAQMVSPATPTAPVAL